jgi:putative protein-disulfide isomerase
LQQTGLSKFTAMALIPILWLGLVAHAGCQTQPNNNMTNNNPLLCDPEKGACEIPATTDSAVQQNHVQQNTVKVIYFTDPICSSCWGIEPQLRKLKLEYGDAITIEYRMGGLLPDWSYNSGGISKPSDVAHHWDEVSQYYDMPIDGDVWLEDPLDSSYPPSIAFKAAQMQDKKLAILFLRRIREMVFLEKKNITKWMHLSEAAQQVGLDTAKLKTDYEHDAKQLFQADLALSRQMGVRGFPTLFFIDSMNNQQTVYGFRPYKSFEDAVLKADANANKKKYDTNWQQLFKTYPTLTTREFAELSGVTKADSEILLQQLNSEGKTNKLGTKNGVLWSVKLVLRK